MWFEHLDEIHQYADIDMKKRRDIATLRRPSSTGYITFILDETVITEELISEIANALKKPGKQFMQKLEKLLYGHAFALRFFDCIELAKEFILSRTIPHD